MSLKVLKSNRKCTQADRAVTSLKLPCKPVRLSVFANKITEQLYKSNALCWNNSNY